VLVMPLKEAQMLSVLARGPWRPAKELSSASIHQIQAKGKSRTDDLVALQSSARPAAISKNTTTRTKKQNYLYNQYTTTPTQLNIHNQKRVLRIVRSGKPRCGLFGRVSLSIRSQSW